MEAMGKFVERSLREGTLVDTGGLLPSKDGLRIRLAQGKLTINDGPFAESKEVVGGFFVVLAKNLSEAIEIAKECPDYALNGTVEVREVMKFDNMEPASTSKLETQNS